MSLDTIVEAVGKPYFRDDAVAIYHADCRDILPLIPTESIDLVLTDPPYGVGERTNRESAGRGVIGHNHDYPPICGDDVPFDPAVVLGFPRAVLFGANHYADRLPPSPSWLVWDKRDGMKSDDNADCEMAWTSLGGPARLFRHLWKGYFRATQATEPRCHPTEKPVALMRWVLLGWTEEGDTILDPFMGSGTTLRAAKDLGRYAIGIEIEEKYCEIAAKRMAQTVMKL